MSWSYPKVRRDDTIDVHGLPDPYRWLEQPESSETRTWVSQQNEISQKYISSCPFRDQIKNQLKSCF